MSYYWPQVALVVSLIVVNGLLVSRARNPLNIFGE